MKQKLLNVLFSISILITTTTVSFANESANPELKSSFQTEDGIIILAAPEGVFKSGSQLYAQFLDPDSQEYQDAFKNLDDNFKNVTERLKVYDIFVLDPYGNKVTQFNDYVTLYIQIPKDYDDADLDAIHITEGPDQEFEEWIETIDGTKYLAFKTNHFSPYAIIDKSTSEFQFLLYIFTPILLISTILLILYLSRKQKKI